MIPKVIHLSWKTKDFWNSQNPLFLNGMNNLKKQNPEYAIQVSDDCDVNDYIQSCISNDDWLLLKDKHIVEKTDLWRLLKIYYEGGIYCDIDRLVNIPLKDIIRETDKCILPIHQWIDFSQDIIIAEKGLEHIKKAIDLNMDRRREGCNDVLSLGPITYFHAITLTHIKKQYSRFLERKQFQIIKDIIELNEGFRCIPEYPPETILFNPRRESPRLQLGNGGSKEDFYQEAKTTHWTNDKSTINKKIYGN